MAKYNVEILEHWVRRIEVEADNEDEAIEEAHRIAEKAEIEAEFVEDSPQRPYVELVD